MEIKMSNKEFQETRKFILEMKNPKANKAFNEVFSLSKDVKGYVNPITKEVIIVIPESTSLEVEKVFVKYAPDIAKMSKGSHSITNAPKWLACIKNIYTDITTAINRQKNRN